MAYCPIGTFVIYVAVSVKTSIFRFSVNVSIVSKGKCVRICSPGAVEYESVGTSQYAKNGLVNIKNLCTLKCV